MKSIYVITMWSGGRPAKKWQSSERPETTANGMGVRFVCRDTKLSVQIIGSISVEEFESGKEEIEIGFYHDTVEPETTPKAVQEDTENIERLF